MDRLSPELLIATMRALAGLGLTAQDFGEPAIARPRPAHHDDGRSSPSWDTPFLQSCGYWSHYDHATRTSNWPIPVDLTTAELALFGEAHDILHAIPEPGDIFLQWDADSEAFVHTGVVVQVLGDCRIGTGRAFDVYTVEGDTNQWGQLAGGRAMRVVRHLFPSRGDCFLRWCNLQTEGRRRARLGPKVA